ncbi:hypothetical protein V5O48_019094, partial [Marasmius crinis-equi]
MRYGVTIKGWPKGLPFQKPSAFGGALDPLIVLHDAWNTGAAHFRKIGDEEFSKWKAECAEGIRDQTVTMKPRKKRSDAGVSKKGKGKENVPEKPCDEADNEEEEEEEPETNAKAKKTQVQGKAKANSRGGQKANGRGGQKAETGGEDNSEWVDSDSEDEPVALKSPK